MSDSIIPRCLCMLIMSSESSDAANRLGQLEQPPNNLFFRGADIHQLNLSNATAIVGSRTCSDVGLGIAYNLGRKLALEGTILISGLALGIDSSAFEGALSANGVCIAVMPSSVDLITPKSNTALAEEILNKQGCLVSEYPESSTAKKYTYIRRNELIAALSTHIVLAEARPNGGAWHTVRAAWKLGKEVSKLEDDGTLKPLIDSQRRLF
jgi:DNA processing protein